MTKSFQKNSIFRKDCVYLYNQIAQKSMVRNRSRMSENCSQRSNLLIKTNFIP